MNDIDRKMKELMEKRELAKHGGGKERIEKQHKKGKLTARERIDRLLDSGSFNEIGMLVTHRAKDFDMDKKVFYGDGVITGYGTINGRLVYVYAQDFTVLGGSLGEMHGKKIAHIYDLAIKSGAPVIGLIDSSGARIQEGIDSLASYGEIFHRNVLASGFIPQISIICGPSAGGASYSPALQDFIVMVKNISYLFVTGPKVVKTELGEEVTSEELGGGEMHATISGTAHFLVDSEEEAFELIRKLLSYIPQNSMESPEKIDGTPSDRDLDDIIALIAKDVDNPYDVHLLLQAIFDRDSFLEVFKSYAKNVVIGFARIDGYSVGVVANNPAYNNGYLNSDAADKIARFVRFCDAFNIPIITFVDTPHPVAGKEEAEKGVVRHGAKIIYAFSESTIPKITVIIRRAFGGGYLAMSSKHIGADIVYAWPTAQIAVLPPKAAVEILYGRKLSEAEDREALYKAYLNEYIEKISNPYVAAARGYVDEVIRPGETRFKLIKAIESLVEKKALEPWINKKHSNMPL